MADIRYGRVLFGSEDVLKPSWDKWARQPVDQDMPAPEGWEPGREQTTLKGPVSVTGPGTFFGKAQRTLTFDRTSRFGWWFDRTDIPESMPIRVSVNNVWTTVRNIVLSSGSPHNYMRMVEHIVALKVGLGLDNVLIRMDSGDPPLFERSSMDLVDAVDHVGIVTESAPAPVFTVREPVTVVAPNGSFVTCLPAEKGDRRLHVDCAVDFRSAIGRQRIRFTVTPETFRYGALARTNTTLAMMLYCKTVGLLFADTRHLGYTLRNIMVAGRWRYVNQPRMMHHGRSFEAVWHRATLDLLAAVALMDRGRLAGTIISSRAGHTLDVRMIRELYECDVLVEL